MTIRSAASNVVSPFGCLGHVTSAYRYPTSLIACAALMVAVFAFVPTALRAETRAEAQTAAGDVASERTETGPRPFPKPKIPDCARRKDKLGLSRVVEIDTSATPRFGDQYSHRGETRFLEDGEVVITFDDGPLRRYTLPILDALDKECTRATFFAVGRMAIADPRTLREIADRGHTLATHTWSHKKLSKVSSSRMKREVELGLSAIVLAAGVPVSPFFRFPYLGHSNSSIKYVESRGLSIMGIHIDSSDFRTRRPEPVIRRIMSQLKSRKKGILLFHDIQRSTARAITDLLKALKKGGYKVVHIVPKTEAVTLPEYDAMAAKLFKNKRAAASRSPVAKRAATWPISGASGDNAGSSGSSQASNKKRTKPKRNSYAPDDAFTLRTFGLP